jgi:2'-5' RNA ligase
MRVFVALDIDATIAERLERFLDGVREFAPQVRWVPPESLHVTLKFVGETTVETVEQITQALSSVQADAMEIAFRGYGFFPTAKAPRVFWAGIESGPQLAALAKAVDGATGALGLARDDHGFSPHLTLARSRGGSGAPGWRTGDSANQHFRRLQEKLAARPAPEFGTMTAREFFLYQSQLLPGGARYSKIARFALA